MAKNNRTSSILGAGSPDGEGVPQPELTSTKTSPLSFFRQRKWATAVVLFISIGALGAGLKRLDEDAESQRKLPANERSLLSSVNPFIPSAPPTATPQLSKEYIYAGSRLLAVEDANASAAPPADLAIWRRSSGQWYVRDPQNGVSWATVTWGVPTDTPVPGDYDGDGRTDFAIYRPDPNQVNNDQWYIINSATNTMLTFVYGTYGDEEAPADYDGDGKTDPAIYRPTTGVWHIQGTSYGYRTFSWGGQTGDKIASADYDGDGRADLGIWRDAIKTFFSINSSDSGIATIQFAQNSTEPVSADYDGDGRADYAIKSGGNWVIRKSTAPQTHAVIAWQGAGDVPVPNDYDGDGKCDIAVWRPQDSGAGDAGYWFIRQSSLEGQAGMTRIVGWGQPGDVPVPAFFRR